MVRIVETGFLSDIRKQGTYRTFPDGDLQEIASALKAVPAETFEETANGTEIRRLAALVAEEFPGYEYEHDPANGRNHVRKPWEGLDHSVDRYHPGKRIAIAIEKSERKRVSDDVPKFVKGGQDPDGERKEDRVRLPDRPDELPRFRKPLSR